MKIDFSNAIAQVETSKNTWQQISSGLPSPDNLQNTGVAEHEITNALDEIEAMLRSIDGNDVSGIAGSQVKGNIESIANQMVQLFKTHGANPAQINANVPSICNWLWTLKTQCTQLLQLSDKAKKKHPQVEQEITAKIAAVEGWFARAEELKASLDGIEDSAKKLLGQIEGNETSATTSTQTIQEILTKIQAFEREASTAKTNAESAATSATTESDEVSEMVKELADSIAKKDALFEEFEGRRDEISGLLENANKVGLAKSFQDKRIELSKTWQVWAGLFFVGIICLALIGYLQLLPLLQAEKLDPVALGFRFLLSGPVIWFTWFAARQYGHVLRISEDYAFKEAAAMAFVGYRNEVETNPDMLKMLQENAIRNFGSNPAKLLLHKADSASPIHEALDRALEKVNPEALISALSKLTGRDQ